MRVSNSVLPGVKLIHMDVHHDSRGHFVETWHMRRYNEIVGAGPLVQHNQSFSGRNVLRGMHYQRERGQGKLIRVVQGRIWDVAVDLRPGSPAFGKWFGIELSGPELTASECEQLQLWIPPGFAHGFLVLSSHAIVEYLCSDFYVPDDEVCLKWDDPDVNIAWPGDRPVLSSRDACGMTLKEIQDAHLLPVLASPVRDDLETDFKTSTAGKS